SPAPRDIDHVSLHDALPILSRKEDTMYSLIRRIERWMIFVGGACLVAMMLHVSIDVISKYVFNHPVPLTMEMVSYYYMTAVAFLDRKSTRLNSSHVKNSYAV